MNSMNEFEWKRFIQEGTRTGKLSTIRSDGRPHCVPVWCIFEDGMVIFMTWSTSAKAKNLRRDDRVSITFDSDEFPYDFVTIEGKAAIKVLPADKLLAISRRIASRYVPAERAEEFAGRNAVEGEVLVSITPVKVISAKGVAT
jgi:PPOX class probable F420-dependent enzyme